MKNQPGEASIIKNRVKYYSKKIKKCRDLEQMDFFEFKNKLGRELPLSWENEKIYMDWEAAITNLKYYQKTQ